MIIPLDSRKKLFAELVASIRNQKQTAENGFEREDETFDHSDASLFSDCSVARLFDALATAPFAECLAVEL